MFNIILLIISFSSLLVLIAILKELNKYIKFMCPVPNDCELDEEDMNSLAEQYIDEVEDGFYDSPPSTNDLYDVSAYKERMKNLREEQDKNGFYDCKIQQQDKVYFTGVEEPEE